MPLLPAEPSIYPPDLFAHGPAPLPSPESEGPNRWWCLHTKPRQEKAAARFMRDHQLAHYLPQVVKEGRTPGGRRTRSVVPLFTSYLFLKGSPEARLEAFRGANLVNVLWVEDQDRLEEDLAQIHRMLESGLPVNPEPQIPIGARVRILDGPLADMVGTVTRRGNRDHFIAVVHFLGRGATVELESWQVERLDD